MAGIYVHIPFCSQACYYCDFHFSTSLKTKNRVINAINTELVIQKDYLKKELITTIYFGGGTPSLMEHSLISSIYYTIFNNFNLSKNIEFTIEANPEDITKEKTEEWSSIGINRISLGIQSFEEEDLKYMNRVHNKEQALLALETLKQSKIKNISVDLIYGFPLLTNDLWIKNLEQIISLDIPHLSCYCLTVENKTPLDSFIKKGIYKELDSDAGKTQFLIARNQLIRAGYIHYEISNFSKPGYGAKHNQNYWNKSKYLGVGPSAHSFNGKSRQWNTKNNSIYCKNIENNNCFWDKEILTRKNIINEYILTSIRTRLGADINYIKDNMNQLEFNNFNLEINKLEKKKLIDIEKKTIYLTQRGMLFADNISEKLVLI